MFFQMLTGLMLYKGMCKPHVCFILVDNYSKRRIVLMYANIFVLVGILLVLLITGIVQKMWII